MPNFRRQISTILTTWIISVVSFQFQANTMLRMILAAITVYFLLPEDVRLVSSNSQTMEPVSAGETLDAANSVISDITKFCERNPDACETGKALILNAKRAVSDTINNGVAENQHNTNEPIEPSVSELITNSGE